MRAKKIFNGRDGFTIIELLIVMTLFVIVLAITTATSTTILRQSTQQSKAAETQMESIVGLEMLRTDIEHAGYGLAWLYPGTLVGYQEALSSPSNNYNDASNSPPRAILGGNNLTTYVLNNSDYLVIKSTISGMNEASQKWSYIVTGTTTKSWETDNLSTSDNIIIIRPKTGDSTMRQLILNSSSNFTTAYNNISSFPVQNSDLIYGINTTGTTPSMPFNRADYYVRRPASGMPALCSANTGILYKATVNHGTGGLYEMPLLDCVADMQVVFNLDMNEDGAPGTFSNPDGTLVSSPSEGKTATDVQNTLTNAELLRKRLKEVRVYILSHEGQRDPGYTYPNTTITLGDSSWSEGIKKTFNLSTTIGGYWRNYRWKVHTIVVKPKNLY